MRARYGRRIRRGVAGTAVAAAAMAALTGSQAPGLLPGILNTSAGAPIVPPPGDPIDGNSSEYFTALPPLNTPAPGTSATPGTGPGTGTGTTDGTGLPVSVLEAYRRAETALAASDPGCNLRWELLAAIGQVESNQARSGNVDSAGTTLSPILGPVLNGNGFANITDTDDGVWDGDKVHDRAVGPMQFIPSTWQTWGADGNDDGVTNPNNIFDAALAAGRYLCAGNRDLSVEHDLHRAILGYNNSTAYLNTVLSWYDHFRKGDVVSVPDVGGAGSDTPDDPPSSTAPSTSPSPTWSPSMSASPRPTKSSTPTATASGTIGPLRAAPRRRPRPPTPRRRAPPLARRTRRTRRPARRTPRRPRRPPPTRPPRRRPVRPTPVRRPPRRQPVADRDGDRGRHRLRPDQLTP